MPDRTVQTTADPVPPGLRDAILGWYASRGRQLAFRGTRDPFAILVSEAMAQQTQAARAGEVWVRFMEAFPTVGDLAAATPADVLRAWQGLGYNRRALNLWRAARRIVDVHGGRVPADVGALEELPGVGPYTARAVAAIAFGLPVGAVDTNVRRVLGRIVAGDARTLGAAALQEVADSAVPHDKPGAWTHALMDLGATVCLPRRPGCPACPAIAWCRYAAIARAGAGGGEPGARYHPVAAPAAATAAGVTSQSVRAIREPAVPFAATSRWVRGRIVDRLRAAEPGAWMEVAGPIGGHDAVAVAAALDGLERDGLIELDSAGTGSTGRRARLPLG